jgi:hypothetical protein
MHILKITRPVVQTTITGDGISEVEVLVHTQSADHLTMYIRQWLQPNLD